MFGKEIGDHVRTECVRDSAVAGRPTANMGTRVGPQEVAGETMVGDLCVLGGGRLGMARSLMVGKGEILGMGGGTYVNRTNDAVYLSQGFQVWA